MGDIQVKGVHTRPKIKDWRRLQLDNYYLSVDKADTANKNKDLRQLYIPELSRAVEDELQYLVVFENFNKRINDVEQDISKLQADLIALTSRVWDLEQTQQVILDGIYALGYSASNLLWSPGVTTPVAVTRIPLATTTLLSNLTQPDAYGFVPAFSADYTIDVRLWLDLSAATNNRTWNIAVFDNDVQSGPGFSFNTRDYVDLLLTAQIGGSFQAGDKIDIRLWSTNSSSSLTIYDFSYYMRWEGLDAAPV